VNKPRLPGKETAISLVRTALPFLLVFWLATLGVATAFARAWSYHYAPIAPEPSPAVSATEASIMNGASRPAAQLPTALLLKRAIVSDLALFIQEQNGRPDKVYEYLVRKLSSFDRLSSPEALAVFASLSGYYLGASGEELYDCLSLRKGKALEPYLERYIHGNAECSQELGRSFTKSSAALGGYALCPNAQQQKVHLTTLIAEIDSAKLCSNGNLAAITTRARPFPLDTR
jgi:hypothetical protein